MAKPCRPEHGDYQAGCRLCELAATDEKYAAFWGEKMGGVTVTVADPSAAGLRRPLPCLHLGRRVNAAGCLCWARDSYQCTAGMGAVVPAGVCQDCELYEADE